MSLRQSFWMFIISIIIIFSSVFFYVLTGRNIEDGIIGGLAFIGAIAFIIILWHLLVTLNDLYG